MKPVRAFWMLAAVCLPACAGVDFSACPASDSLSDYITNFGSYVDAPPYFNGCTTTSGFGYGGFWWFANSSTGGSTVASDADVTVTPDGSFGFDFNFGTVSVVAGDTVTYEIAYTMIDPPPIVGGDLGFDPTGDVTATLSYCDNSDGSDYANVQLYYVNHTDGAGCGDPSNQVTTTSDPITLITLDLVNGPTSGSGTFAGGPYSEVGILLTITLTGGDSGATFSGITADPALEGETPEPSPFWLVGTALAALAFLKIRRRARA